MSEFKTKMTDEAKAALVMLALTFVFGLVVGLAIGTVLMVGA